MFTEASDVLDFLRSGRAIVTLQSKKSGAHFTYSVKQREGDPFWFVGVLTGPDNRDSYSYIGFIKGDTFIYGKKSKIEETAPSVQTFAWFWKLVISGQLHPSLEVRHEGKCGKCGRKLTTPESLKTGIGPECRKRG